MFYSVLQNFVQCKKGTRMRAKVVNRPLLTTKYYSRNIISPQILDPYQGSAFEILSV